MVGFEPVSGNDYCSLDFGPELFGPKEISILMCVITTWVDTSLESSLERGVGILSRIYLLVVEGGMEI